MLRNFDKGRVLIINSMSENGGISTYTLGLARGMKQKGHQVNAFLTHGKGSLYSEFSDVFDHISTFEGRSSINRYCSLLLYVWQYKPDYIIINYNGTSHFLLPLFPASRVISVIHNAQTDFYRICNINKRFINAWVDPSPRVASEFVNYSKLTPSDSRIHVIAHGVDTAIYSRGTDDREMLNIAFIGALYEHKGVYNLHGIFSRLLLECPNLALTIIGSGPEEHSLKQSIDGTLVNKVTFTGQLPSSELKSLLSRTDVLLFPTRLEAFGLVIAESMAQGVVPVVSCLPGITDFIVEDGTTGFLVEPDDIDGFVAALRKLYSNRDLLSDMSERCKNVAKKRFSHKEMMSAYCQLFESLNP